MKIGRRDTHGVRPSVRMDGDTPKVIEGYAAVYYNGTRETEYELWPGTIERIMPGAFDGRLQDDIRALFNHRSDLILGRREAETLRLSIDDRGLRYEIDAADTTVSRDVIEHLRRGDVTGSSFAFRGADSEWLWDQPIADGEYTADIRQINGFSELLDVGPVTYPAYTGTAAGARSEDAFPEARDAHSDARAAYEEAKRSRRALDRAIVDMLGM